MIKPSQQRKLVRKAYDRFYKRRPDLKGEPGSCLYVTHELCLMLHALGHQVRPIGGSLHWRIVPPEKDDGRILTHFAFQWERHMVASAPRRSILPEMHVWLIDYTDRALVDGTTGELVTWTRAAGIPWLDRLPPKFLWTPLGQEPPQAIYEPDRDATVFVAKAMNDLFGNLPAYYQDRVPFHHSPHRNI